MARIDIHTHEDHGHPGDFLGSISGKAAKIIADCAQSDTGEPIFVLRAQDIFSIMGIAGYLDLIEKFSPNDHNMEAELCDVIEMFKRWQSENRDQVRYPD